MRPDNVFYHERHERTWRGLIARNPHGLYTDGTRTLHGRQIGRLAGMKPASLSHHRKIKKYENYLFAKMLLQGMLYLYFP